MVTTVNITKQAIVDLLKIKDDFDAVIESLELMSDQDFMDSYNQSKKQIEKREFVDWDDL